MSGDELVSLDVLGSYEDLRAAARDERTVDGSDTEAEGRDASRAVVVRVDRHGRVSDVLISAWWRDDLTPSGLQEALLSAYQAALAQATSRIVLHEPDSTTSADTAPTAGEDQEGDDYGWMLSVRRRLDRTQEALVRSAERLSQQDIERVHSGPGGLVRLVLTGDVVAAVLIDAHAAMQETPNRLGADALAAFQTIN